MPASRPERALLPCEPRVENPTLSQQLTEQHLSPALAELEQLFLTLRQRLDPHLRARISIRNGKPYPLGQCLEISMAVKEALEQLDPRTLEPEPLRGFCALRDFLKAGGSMRLIWGALREQYFQNAFLIGTLYVDVSNDTVVPTKPKVEILPLAASQLLPIRDHSHYGRIARSYWKDQLWPNHALPELAPFLPWITERADGWFQLMDPSAYMLLKTTQSAFRSCERVLREAPMPPDVFERFLRALGPTVTGQAASPQEGRARALRECRRRQAQGLWRAYAHIEQNAPRWSALNLHLQRAGQQAKQRNVLFYGSAEHPTEWTLLTTLVKEGHRVRVISDHHRPLALASSHGALDWQHQLGRLDPAGVVSLTDEPAPDVIVCSGLPDALPHLRARWPHAVIGSVLHPSDLPATNGTLDADQASTRWELGINTLDALLCFDESQRQQVPTALHDRLSIQAAGVDSRAIGPNPSNSLQLNNTLTFSSQDEILTLVCQRLNRSDGFATLMNGLPELLQHRPQAHVLIVGDDDLSADAASNPNGIRAQLAQIEPRMKPEHLSRVHFLGQLNPAQVISILQCSTVHLHLSRSPALSTSLLEAMSCARPVLAHDSEAVRRLLPNDTLGLRVDTHDFDATLAALDALLDDPERRHHYGQRARLHIVEHWDSSTVCLPRQYLWLESLLKRSRQAV